MICGITPPDLRTTTVSPTCSPKSRMKSSLCSVARLTVLPSIRRGARCASGASFPVRPTFTLMASRVVSTSSTGNLYAMAHLGARLVKPASSCRRSGSSFRTVPSASNSKVWRRAVMRAW